MNISPKNLNLPLKRSGHFGVWFCFACVVLAAFLIKPSTVAGWVVTILFVAPAFWFGFSGPAFLNNWARNHRYFFAEWLVFAIKLAVFFMVTKFMAPVAISLLSEWLHT